MITKLEETIKKINALIDSADKEFKANELMQLSQSALNLANTAATIAMINKK